MSVSVRAISDAGFVGQQSCGSTQQSAYVLFIANYWLLRMAIVEQVVGIGFGRFEAAS